MDWSKGFSASCYMSVVDPDSWRDIQRMELTGGRVSKMSTGLRQSADVTCTEFDVGKEIWIRIYMTVSQGRDSVNVPLFTGLATSSDTDVNGTRKEYPVQCYSVLKPAQDTLLLRGWYAPVETVANTLFRMLLGVCPAPLVIDAGCPSLTAAIIAGKGETNLSMVDRILTAINWRMVLEGDGTIHICPKASKVSMTFDALEYDVIEPEVTLARDWFDCPNIFRAVQDDLTAIARDDDPDSFLSTVRRGREVWKEEDGCDFAEGETIGEYAIRRLREEQQVALVVSYSRRFHPDVKIGDIIRLAYPGSGLEGAFTVNTQSMELGKTSIDEEVIL